MREPKNCANPECGEEFVPKAHNGIYCKEACRTYIMNKRVLERYYEKKARKNSKVKRVCSRKNCSNILSSYNSASICETCKTEKLIKRLVGWGYSERTLRDEYSE